MNRLVILEKRLKLLKESFDAGVIDAEEYRRNKEKIEKEIENAHKAETTAKETTEEKIKVSDLADEPQKSQELEQAQKADQDDLPKESEQETPREQLPDQTEEEGRQEEIFPVGMGGDISLNQERQPEFHEETPDEEVSKIIGDVTFGSSKESSLTQETEDSEEKAESKKTIEILQENDEGEEKETEEEEIALIPTSRQKKKHGEDHTLRTVIWIVGAIIILGFLVFFSINLGERYPNETTHNNEEQKPIIACYQHADCAMNGLESKCVNGGKAEAMCQYQNSTPVSLIIIGDGECASCSSARMKNVLVGWFPGAVVRNVLSSSSEGKSLRLSHSLEMLPSYVLDSAVEDTLLFSDVKGALRISGESYIVKDSASGAPLFLNRNDIAGQIDVFVAPSDESSKRAILNLEEFLDSFGDKVTIAYHVVKDLNSSKIAACVVELAPQRTTEYLLCDAKSDDDCVTTLGLGAAAIDACVENDSFGFIGANTKLQNSLGIQVPSFLINNRMKVGGVQAADMLREQFCSMNDATACSNELKKSLV